MNTIRDTNYICQNSHCETLNARQYTNIVLKTLYLQGFER